MTYLRARLLLVLTFLGAASAVNCGSSGSEDLFPGSSSAGSRAAGAGANSAGAHSAGAAGAPTQSAGSGGDSAGAGDGQAGSAVGGMPAAMAGSAGQAAAGTSGAAAGGATAGSGGAPAIGGSGGAGGAVCLDNGACSVSEYCAKDNCLAKAEGHCAPRPSDCSNAKLAVVCGCDGVTYHDACLLHANSQNAGPLDSGACAKNANGTLTCSEKDDTACTDAGGVCAFEVAAVCAPITMNETGTCWVLPGDCPGSDGKTVLTCSEQAGGQCTSQCEAIKARERFGSADKCK